MTQSEPDMSRYFADAWFAPGLVDRQLLEELGANCCEADDLHPEHYRWRAFSKILERRRPLGPSVINELLALAANDPDSALGESMAIAALTLPECPAELRPQAPLDSPRMMELVRARRARDLLSKPNADGAWTLVSVEFWRDGGSYSATLEQRGNTVSLWLQVLPWDRPADRRYGALFVSNGNDATRMSFGVDPQEELSWARALSGAVQRSAGDDDSRGIAAELAAILDGRAAQQ